ncbi:MAG: hypothetical protein LQ346_005850, partial [Caloplaca aetnensis]
MASQTDWPPSPSAFSHQPRSANSWTARTFTTLQPSDSPSQAQFPKHSQASLLLQSRRQQHGPAPQSKQQATVKSKKAQTSFLVRNLLFVGLAAVFHISLIAVTTLLVLIITAATATPRRRIQPGYWIGVILSFASGLASIIITYVKWNERKINLSTDENAQQPDANNAASQAELGLTPSAFPRSPVEDIRAVVSNWGPSAAALGAPHHIRALLAHRNPLASASARIAGSNNRPQITNDQGIEMQSLHPDPDRQHPAVNNTAIELQRFLDHELERQEAIRRRIGTWLKHIPLAQQQIPQPSLASTSEEATLARTAERAPQQRPHRQRRNQRPHLFVIGDDPDVTRIPANPARLAEIEAEIEAYLGHPPPPLPVPVVMAPQHQHHREQQHYHQQQHHQHQLEHQQQHQQEHHHQHPHHQQKEQERPPSIENGIENGIDYAALPPAVPRPGATARDPVRSDPTTVVYVGPMNEEDRVCGKDKGGGAGEKRRERLKEKDERRDVLGKEKDIGMGLRMETETESDGIDNFAE